MAVPFHNGPDVASVLLASDKPTWTDEGTRRDEPYPSIMLRAENMGKRRQPSAAFHPQNRREPEPCIHSPPPF